MQELLGKITSTFLVTGTFSFIASMAAMMVAGVASGFAEDLADILFFIFGVIFLLSVVALPIVAIAYIWT